MRASEAPPAGWYPDPEGRAQLRWWEGTDWSDRYRARPYAIESAQNATGAPAAGSQSGINVQGTLPSVNVQVPNSAQLVDQMRAAARGEADYAAQLLDARIRQAQDTWKPLVSEYTNRAFRWFKWLAFFAVLIVIGYIVFQVFAQQSMMDWLGDRIDNLSNDNGSLIQVSSLLISRG